MHRQLLQTYNRVKQVLSELGLEAPTVKELLTYLSAQTYEEDRLRAEDIVRNEYLMLHELVEIAVLKRMGWEITRDVIVRAYPDTYKAHLVAMRAELEFARRRGDRAWLARRLRDLKSYLSDPYLPRELIGEVRRLISDVERWLRELEE